MGTDLFPNLAMLPGATDPGGGGEEQGSCPYSLPEERDAVDLLSCNSLGEDPEFSIIRGIGISFCFPFSIPVQSRNTRIFNFALPWFYFFLS